MTHSEAQVLKFAFILVVKTERGKEISRSEQPKAKLLGIKIKATVCKKKITRTMHQAERGCLSAGAWTQLHGFVLQKVSYIILISSHPYYLNVFFSTKK